MAGLMALLGESPLGCEREQGSLGSLPSLPQASPCLPQKEARTERVGAQMEARGLPGAFGQGRVTGGQGDMGSL